MAAIEPTPEALRDRLQILHQVGKETVGPYHQNRNIDHQTKELEDQLMDSSGQGSSGSGGSSPWYGNALAGPPGGQGRKREREDSVDLQYLGIRGEPEAKSQKTTPSPVPSERELYIGSLRGPFNRREQLPTERLETPQQPGLAISYFPILLIIFPFITIIVFLTILYQLESGITVANLS